MPTQEIGCSQYARCLIAVWVLLSTACADPCSNEVLREERSPNGEYVIAVYARGCGIASSTVTHLYLRRTNQKAAFIPERSFSTIEAAHSVEVKWQSNDAAVVSYRADSSASTWPDESKPIVIEFRRVPTGGQAPTSRP